MKTEKISETIKYALSVLTGWYKPKPEEKSLQKEYLITRRTTQKFNFGKDNIYDEDIEVNLYKEKGKISMLVGHDVERTVYFCPGSIKKLIEIFKNEGLIK